MSPKAYSAPAAGANAALEISRRKLPCDHRDAAPLRGYFDRLSIRPPYSEALGFLPLRYPGGPVVPAIVVDRHDADRGDAVGGVHRIFLTSEGQLYAAPARFSLGKIKTGRSILWPAQQHLVIAEAVEAALLARQLLAETGIDWGAWALCGPLRPLPMPVGITEVTIVVPPDGEQRAVALAEWLRSIGRSACLMELDP
jgi:hypothetical protein